MKKYEFSKIDTDTFKLKYKNISGEDIEHTFKRTIEDTKAIMSVNVKARFELMKDLAKNKMSQKDLLIETTDEKGITRIDDTNLRELETEYINAQSGILMEEFSKKHFKLSLTGLLVDIGYNIEKDEKDVEEFATEYMTIISGGELKGEQVKK